MVQLRSNRQYGYADQAQPDTDAAANYDGKASKGKGKGLKRQASDDEEFPDPTPKRTRPAAVQHTPETSSPAASRLQSRIVSNFLVEGGRDMTIDGESTAVNAFEAMIATGHRRVQVRAQDSQTYVVRALIASLKAVHQGDKKKVPGFAIMQSVVQAHGDEFKQLEGDSVREASLLLSLLDRFMGEVYQLGYSQFSAAIQGYRVVLVRPQDDETPTKVAWLHSEHLDETEKLTRWSGFHVPLRINTNVDPGTNLKGLISDDESSLSSPHPSLDPDQELESASVSESGQTEAESLTKGTAKKEGSNTQTKATKPKKLSYILIEDAPPENMSLPYSYMAGITSQEYLTFFPNHSVHWPSMAARLMEDGWSFIGICNYLNQTHDLTSANDLTQGQPPGAQVSAAKRNVLPNSIMFTITRNCQMFYADTEWARHKFVDGSTGKPKARSATLMRQVVKKFTTLPWQPREAKKLQPSWSLQKIGQYFWDRYGAFPCDGPFTTKLERAAKGLPVSANPDVNPPTMPPNWKPGEFKLPDIAKPRARSPSSYKRSHKRLNPKPVTLVKSFARDKSVAYKLTDEEKKNPEEVVRKYHDRLADELLLWLISKNGGMLSIARINDILENHVRETNKTITDKTKHLKTVGRAALSKRKHAALELRASANGTTVADEQDKFDDEQQQARDTHSGLYLVDSNDDDYNSDEKQNTAGVSETQSGIKLTHRDRETLPKTNTNATDDTNQSMGFDAPPGYAPAQPSPSLNWQPWNQPHTGLYAVPTEYEYTQTGYQLHTQIRPYTGVYSNATDNAYALSGYRPPAQAGFSQPMNPYMGAGPANYAVMVRPNTSNWQQGNRVVLQRPAEHRNVGTAVPDADLPSAYLNQVREDDNGRAIDPRLAGLDQDSNQDPFQNLFGQDGAADECQVMHSFDGAQDAEMNESWDDHFPMSDDGDSESMDTDE